MAISSLAEGSEFLGIKGAILISSSVYVKTSADYEHILDALPQNGYIFDSQNMTAKFDDSQLKHTVRCAHCGSVQDDCTGVAVIHNFPCGSCEKPLNVEYERDAEVQFKFVRDDVVDRRSITLKIFDYDMTKKSLRCFPTPIADVFEIHNPLDILEEYKDRYTREEVDVDGSFQELIVIPVRNSPFTESSDHIRKSSISGGRHYYTSVTVLNGIAYDDTDDLPLPTSIAISTEFMNQKLDLTHPKAHEIILRIAGLSSRTTFYREDDFLDYNPVFMQRMNAFVKNFVNVAFKEWENFANSAPKDGPHFINALAKWCALQSNGISREINSKANFMNAVYAAQRQSQGLPLNEETAASAYEGMDDLGKKFGTAVQLSDINPHNLMETVKTIIRGSEVLKYLPSLKKGEGGPK